MAIQRLTAFEAEADILGRLRRVSFTADTGALLVEVTGVDEAAAIIDYLSTGELKSVPAGGLPVASAMPAAEKKVLETAPVEPSAEKAPSKPQEAPKRSSGKGKASGKTKAAKAKETLAKADPEEPEGSPSPGQVEAAAEEEDDHTVLDDMEAATDPSKQKGEDWVSEGREEQEIAEAEEKKAKAVEAAKGGEVPDELKKSKKLRDVIGYMFEEMGITHPDAIIAKCEEIQGEVPVLKRIKGSLKDRVSRTISILEIAE